MIRPIFLYGSEVLRQVAAPVDIENGREEISALVNDLWETLKASDGCGLAAPQIGVSQRVAVVDGDVMADAFPYLKGFKRTFINPVVLSVSDSQCEYEEGCLSVPGKYGIVTRPEVVRVRAQDRNGEFFELEADGLLGRCIQHENDHLDGVTIMQSSDYFYEDTEEGRAEAAERKH